ncbi:hypothetical protein pipiens_016033 [Culex pipiens pipiens]|uniref:pyridoxal 5'-phosphate synthase n=1 Tax=Culex pipiens pipiens TaxID=38569 RepID=A0ABD1CMZ2_CULPP
MSSWSTLRIKYKEPKDIFHESSIEVKEPFHLFRKWFDEACSTPEIIEPNAMCLATATRDAFPSARFVLLKDITDQGFTFFTNYESRKAKELAENPNVALAFYWLPLRRSVRIEGTAERIPGAESAAYFTSDPGSQIVLASSAEPSDSEQDFLDQKEHAIKEELGPDGEVPLPNWGGYLVRPVAVEFWQVKRTVSSTTGSTSRPARRKQLTASLRFCTDATKPTMKLFVRQNKILNPVVHPADDQKRLQHGFAKRECAFERAWDLPVVCDLLALLSSSQFGVRSCT